MREILDMYGNPLKKSELKNAMATPQIAGVRQQHSRYETTGLTPERIARLMRRADDGDMEGYFTMAEEIEEKDAHYQSVLGTRKRAVIQLDITVEAASTDKTDEDNAELIRQWLDRDTLEEELFDILDAIGKGYSIMELMWNTVSDVWMPEAIIYRPQKWFEWTQDFTQLLLREGGGGVPLPLYKFIIHRHKTKSGLPHRGGAIRACSWMYLFKNFSVKDWVIFLETYGQPMRVGKYHSSASEKDKEILLQAVARIGSDAAAIIPESMQIEFITSQGKADSVDSYKKLADFCDAQMSKAVLGQTMTTDSGSSRSQAEVHDEVRQDIQMADARMLAATLNEQLVKPIIILNKGEQKRYPRIRLGRTENVDIEKITNAADKAVRFGMRVSEKALRDKIGLPEPEDEKDVLRLPAAIPQETPVTASALCCPHHHPHHQREVAARDGIDDLSGEMAGDWEDIIDPLAVVLQKAADESSSYEEFIENLLGAAEEMDMTALAEKIRDANFMARIAGNLGLEVK